MQGVVRGRVAGVERHDHVHLLLVQHVLTHVRVYEAQPAVAVLLRDLSAALHHVGLEIVADDGHVHAPLDGEIVVEDKGQIALAAAEIQDRDGVLLAVGKGLVDELHKAVDLLVFVVAGLDHLELRCEHAQVHQGRDVLPLPENIALFPVVPGGCGAGQGGGGGRLFVAPVGLEAVLGALLFGHQQGLAIAPVPVLPAAPDQGLSAQILVEGLGAAANLRLEDPLPPQQQGPYADFGVGGLVDGLAEHRLGERLQRTLQLQGQTPLSHRRHRRAF